jgi:hypothetical protein
MTRAPPRFPEPARDQRTLRHPPLPGTTSPASGLFASHSKNSNLSSSLHSLSASAANVGVSMSVYTAATIRQRRIACKPGHFRAVEREGDRHVAARGRTVHEFQWRRAAPCRNVSASTDLLCLTPRYSPAPPATASNALGFLRAMARSVRAAPLGCLRPCSQP